MNGGEILKAALLGTDKYVPQVFPALGETGLKIMAQPTDKEDRFLKLTIATLLYEEAGRKPIPVEGIMSECPAEILSSINENMSTKIRAALSAKDEVLFHYFIYLVHKRNQVLTAELVPAVLSKALEHKKVARQLLNACGETGKWLCGLNTSWRMLIDETEEENVWETGSFDSRKIFLANIRKSDPAKAIGLLDGAIDRENAANKVMFVELLQARLSVGDEPFLQRLLNDKSQKVKETALSLLQRLQGSVVNRRYLDYLLGVIFVKEERYLLIAKRKVLTIREEVSYGNDIFSTGIGKVSSDKGVADYIYIIGQLLCFIDPAILANRLAVTEDELLTLLLQHKDAHHLRPFLSIAAAQFRNKVWAVKLLSNKEAHTALLDALPKNERTDFYELFLETQLQSLLPYLFDEGYTLLHSGFAGQLLGYLSKNPYVIAQAAYQRLALHLPNDVLAQLQLYIGKSGEDYQGKYFKTQIMEMTRIIEIRNNIN